MDEERDRTLRIEIPPCFVSKVPKELPEWDAVESLNGWRIIEGTLGIYWDGTIDLSGYARDYKTFYPAGGVVQEGAFSTEKLGGGSVVYYIVSTTPLASPIDLYVQLGVRTGPGLINFYGSTANTQNWNTVLFAESQLLVTNTNIQPNDFGVQQTLETRQTGSLAPTAADKLYVRKIVVPLTGLQETLGIPASRIIIPGTMDQEPELEYMMRLSRSVELANQV
jgi:hypothetical protein